MSITHSFVSAKSDGGDATVVRPSDWNDDHVIAGFNAAFIGAKAYHSTTQGSLAAATVNPLDLDSEEFDTDGFHSTSSNTPRMTIPAGLGGKYLVIGKVKLAADVFQVYIRKNGSGGTILRGGNTQSSGQPSEVSVIADLAAGDYVEVVEYHQTNTGTAGDASNDHLRTELAIAKLDSGRLGQGIGASVRYSSSLAISTDPQILLWDTEDYDTDGFHSTSSNTGRLTIPAGMGGWYAISMVAEKDPADGRTRIRKNGDTGATGILVYGAPSPLFIVTLVWVGYLVAGDYVEAVHTHSTGGNYINTDAQGRFSIARLDSGSGAYTGALWGSGTAFPSGPATNDRFTRTDRGLDYFYDGTRWLTTTLFTVPIPTTENQTGNPHNSFGAVTPSSFYQLYVERIIASVIVITTNNGTNYWTVQFKTKSSPNTDTNLGSSFNTSAISVTTYTQFTVTIAATLATTELTVFMNAAKTLSPGALYVASTLSYRLVG